MSSSSPVLVVGAAGQVGTQLCHQLGAQALAAGRSSAAPAHLQHLPWLQVDLAALAAHPASAAAPFAQAGPFAAVICVGGATDVERCETDTDWADAVNTHGPAALAAATPPDTPFVYFSTEYVFDGGAAGPAFAGPYTESSPTHAISRYGLSKLRGEELVLRARPDALILRTTVVYGVDPAGKNFLYFLHRQLSAGQPVRIVTDQVSTPTSNDDLAAATLGLLARRATGVVHVCGPDVLSRFDFALRAARVLNLDPTLIEPVLTSSARQRAPRPLAAGLLTGRLQQLLGPGRMKGVELGVLHWANAALGSRSSAPFAAARPA